MEFVKELFDKYEIRKNKKQKTAFIEWVKKFALDNKWDVEIERGILGTRNIVIGDVDKAKVIYTAHYDTCANMYLPNFITPRNVFIYIIYQVLLCFVLLLPSALIVYIGAFLFPDNFEIPLILSYFILFFVMFMIMAGPANKHTANDNTSGVATVLGLLEKFDSKNDKVAFVLFDFEEIGLVGSTSFAKDHKNIVKDILLINFDCVSDGKTALFVLNKKTRALLDVFKNSFEPTERVKSEFVTKGVFYPSDQVNFKKGIGVCAMKKNGLFKSGYIDRIHTKKDTIFRKENIEYLINGSYKLYKNITK